MPTLVIQIPDMPPVEHVLKEEAMTIGRMKGNSIALDHSSVSLSHAKLTRIGGDYFLKDLNSTNGTMLNGQSITEARLRDGDHVKFGEVMGRFHASSATLPAQLGAPPAPGPPPAPASMPPGRPQPSSAPGTAAPPKTQVFMPKANRLPVQKFLVPIVAGVVGLAVVGLLVWKFAGSSAPAVTPRAAPAQGQRPPNRPAPMLPATTPAETAPAETEQAPTEPASKQDVPSLIQSLKSGDPAERRRAASALNALGPDGLGPEAKDAVPALREALNDTDAEVRTWSALCLINNKVYDKATVPILVQLLHHENPNMRQVACLSLALIPYEDAEKAPVIAALTDTVNRDDDAEVRNAAAAALKAIAPPIQN